jgi:hypothetical protein
VNAQLDLFESHEPSTEEFDYGKLCAWLDKWYDPCPVCKKDTHGMWSGYAMAIHKIYLCMECQDKYFPELR